VTNVFLEVPFKSDIIMDLLPVSAQKMCELLTAMPFGLQAETTSFTLEPLSMLLIILP